MATTQHRTPPGKARQAAAHLAKGFDSLTLDPSPRLRKARSQLQRRDVFREAWRSVGQALAEAVRSVETTRRIHS